ncbi:MAG: YbeD family protein [Arenicellales bacterium]
MVPLMVEEQGVADLLEFPCRFQIKAMGRQIDGFEERVRTIVLRHLNGELLLDLTTRESSESRYVSVSCTIEAQSRQQLDAIYMDLNSEQDVLMTL